MSDACCPTPPEKRKPKGEEVVESCCEFHPPQHSSMVRCPQCGQAGKAVQRITLGALLKPESRPQIPRQDTFSFCRTPDCGVAYFRPDEVLFRKEHLSVRVHQKEPDDPSVPVCYCFDWTPEKIRVEIARMGQSTVLEQVKAQVKTDNCYCEVTNPQGSCCLGNVAKIINHLTASLKKEG